MLNNRTLKIAALLADHQLDALLVGHPATLRYLCGFSGSDGALVVTADVACFLTDSRYTTQAAQEVDADIRREYTVKLDGIIAFLQESGARRVGYEAEHMTCAALERLRAKGGERLEWVPVGKPLLALRGIKDAAEIARLEAAATLAAEAFDEIVPLLRPGTVERDIALALEFAMRRRGGEDRSFDLIVAAGERGAMPHGVASERPLRSGELVTIDFGVRCNGYCSDETVTVAIGDIDLELERIYQVVLGAQQRALAAVRPGVALREIDAVARSYIAEQGYGDCFGHGLGHGVGLEIHEYPSLSPRSEESACEGMVFTIEPGIYVPGKGGVRLEDMVVVTADGCRLLTRIPKALRRLPA